MSNRPPPTTKLIDGPGVWKPRLLTGNARALRPASPAQQLPKTTKDTAILAGWIVLGVGYITAAIPFLGFAIWVIGFLFCGAAGLLGIMGAAKGKPLSGVILILASIASFFLYLLVPFAVIAVMSALSQ